ncbi:Cell cycle serine/threonine-protein kinase cdc5/MSD2 [Xylographa parallela]|nr:Cell cycle serine/threonine-protein kinase cdc5/MSD2 [Xylographa parallela]
MKECLSPRSANIPSKAPPTTKPKDKNHASPPPKYVIQPQGLLGEPGEKYSMGRELGKGGFAICYEGTLLGQKYGKGSTFALKIVKANMGLKKMEEKVIAPGFEANDIMCFALLTGYPPFSDKVQEEIYRKVRCLEYTWPANARNDYPEEAKALVSSLLKTSAEERPEPDQIVGHAFFSMHGANAIPSIIETGHISKKPEWLEDGSPRGDTMARTAPQVSVQALCRQCGVGCFSEIPYAVVGEHVGKSIYQELLWEESVGRAPTVPLPEDFVYASDNSLALEKEAKSKRPVNRRPESMRIPSTRLKSTIVTALSDGEDPRRTLPLRSTSSRSVATSVATSVASMRIPTNRMKSSVKAVSAEEGESRSVQSRSVSGQTDNSTRIPSHTSKSSMTTIESVPEVSRPAKPYYTLSSGTQPSASIDTKIDLKPPYSPSALIGPHDVSDCVAGSRPSEIIAMLEAFSTALAKCLRNITRVNSSPTLSTSRSWNIESRPHVVKWVDYTNKFGIGYILANGSIGCVFNGTEQRASTCIMVPNAEDHLRRRECPTYTERHQIVPRTGPAVAFLENRNEQGLSRTLIPPQHFSINIGKTGLPEKLSPVPNPYDNEKRRMLNLWDKFAKYMTHTLGEKTDSASNLPASSRSSDAGTFVKFYQRLGNVGIWAFANHTFQFNFPDHTKLVLSAIDGGADFYHLSVAAAILLKKGRLLPKAALEERDVLSYPLGVLLAGLCEDKDFSAVIAANELVAKVRFVREVVGVWARNGGLGCMGKREMRWEGLAEVGGRERAVWVTVGKGGGDARMEGVGRKVS